MHHRLAARAVALTLATLASTAVAASADPPVQLRITAPGLVTTVRPGQAQSLNTQPIPPGIAGRSVLASGARLTTAHGTSRVHGTVHGSRRIIFVGGRRP